MLDIIGQLFPWLIFFMAMYNLYRVVFRPSEPEEEEIPYEVKHAEEIRRFDECTEQLIAKLEQRGAFAEPSVGQPKRATQQMQVQEQIRPEKQPQSSKRTWKKKQFAQGMVMSQILGRPRALDPYRGGAEEGVR